MTAPEGRPLVLLRGGGDLATGVALRLTREGFPVVVCELEHPLTVRRNVALSSAVAAGSIVVDGMRGVRAEPSEAVALARGGVVPVVVSPALPRLAAAVVVDARLAKRPMDTTIGDAPFVVGLGPGFVVGRHCHAVVETMRGPDLGRVLWSGSAAPDTGVPGAVEGHGADRVLRAPAPGRARWRTRIGDRVERGAVLGTVAGVEVRAAFDGVIRGLIGEDVEVPAGRKIGDVDPRPDAEWRHISDKALAVGGGVLEAVLEWGRREGDPRGGSVRAGLGRTLAGFLGLGDRELVAFVGAGGKTTLMLALGEALAAEGRRVLLTTTTRVGAGQVAGVRGFWFQREVDGKLVGPAPAAVDDAWRRSEGHDVVLVEADGARGLLAKAPAPHEPVIPSSATVVVAVIGGDALGRRIDEIAHRPERVAAVAGCSVGDPLTVDRAVRMVTSPAGLRKGVPAAARYVAAITRVGPSEEADARRLATLLGADGVPAVCLERIA